MLMSTKGFSETIINPLILLSNDKSGLAGIKGTKLFTI